jgi:hypothetical protein
MLLVRKDVAMVFKQQMQARLHGKAQMSGEAARVAGFPFQAIALRIENVRYVSVTNAGEI